MSTPSISFSGLASGIDTSSIISQLTTVAQKPITLLQGKDDGYNAALSAWQQFNTNLSSLQTAADDSEPAVHVQHGQRHLLQHRRRHRHDPAGRSPGRPQPFRHAARAGAESRFHLRSPAAAPRWARPAASL